MLNQVFLNNMTFMELQSHAQSKKAKKHDCDRIRSPDRVMHRAKKSKTHDDSRMSQTETSPLTQNRMSQKNRPPDLP
jgi:hypothetical protein